ncbi:MAG: hypothetical protein ABEK03_10565 [Candidatus Bipolaricaulia bacterium]
MGLDEDRSEFRSELEERLETAHYKDPQALWEATVQPWWELAAEALRSQGYACAIDVEASDVRRMRVWNERIGWPQSDAAELVYACTPTHVEITEQIAHRKDPLAHRSELPVSRLNAEKVREHLRRFVKDIKAYVATLPEPSTPTPDSAPQSTADRDH